MLLCGAATAAAGPIGFVGLTVPHVARAICGPDYRWILPWSLVLAPIAPARRRRHRPGRRPARRAAGRHRHRPARRPVLHRPRPPAEAGRAVRALARGRAPRRPTGSLVVRVRAARAGPPRVARRGRWWSPSSCVAIALVVFAWSLAVGDFPIPLGDVLRDPRRPGDAEHRLHRPDPAPAPGPDRARWSAPPSACRAPSSSASPATRWPAPTSSASTPGAAAAAVFVIVVAATARRTQVTLRRPRRRGRARRSPSTCSPTSGASPATGSCSSASASPPCSRSVTSYLLTRAEIFDAQRATVWLTGSLNGRGWDHVRPLGVAARRARARSRSSWPATCGCSSWATTPRRASARGSSACARALLLVGGRAGRGRHGRRAGPVGFVALVVAADRPPPGRRPRRSRLLPGAACRRRCCWSRPTSSARRLFAPTELPVGDRHRRPRRALPPLPARPGQPDRRRRMTDDPIDRRPTPDAARPRERRCRLAYDDRVVVDDLSLDDPDRAGHRDRRRQRLRQVDAAARPGPPAEAPRAGTVLLDGEDIHRLPTREVATRLGILPQQPIAPEGITVADLVARGRHPHQRWFRQWSHRRRGGRRRRARRHRASPTSPTAAVDELSGGQRQRVWIALALAQGTAADAARRADDVPRPRPPGRGARPARRAQRAPRAARSCSCSTTSTWPAATPTTSWR